MPAAKKLSLAATLKALTPFLAADKKPEDLEAALRAAADALPESAAKSEAVKDKRAKDRKARDEARAAKDAKEDEDRAKDRKARDEKISKDRSARDEKFAADNEDPEGTNDADVMKACDADMKAESEAEDAEQPPAETGTPSKGGKSEPGTMDRASVDAVVAAAVQKEREAGKALRVALDKVAPVLGKVTFDSAPEAYRAALTKLAVDHKGVEDSALAALLDAATRNAPSPTVTRAHDAAADAELTKLIPHLNRL